jgi:hypothetical protein
MLGSVAWDVCAQADDVKWRCVRKCRFRAQWEPFLKCAILNSPLLRRFSVPRRLLLRVDVLARTVEMGQREEI